jgi:hypothetical protein
MRTIIMIEYNVVLSVCCIAGSGICVDLPSLSPKSLLSYFARAIVDHTPLLLIVGCGRLSHFVFGIRTSRVGAQEDASPIPRKLCDSTVLVHVDILFVPRVLVPFHRVASFSKKDFLYLIEG